MKYERSSRQHRKNRFSRTNEIICSRDGERAVATRVWREFKANCGAAASKSAKAGTSKDGRCNAESLQPLRDWRGGAGKRRWRQPCPAGQAQSVEYEFGARSE